MGKYSTFSRARQQQPRNRDVHPVMRGIGCILIIIVPILAYIAAMVLIGNWGTLSSLIPAEWYGPPTLPAFLWNLQGLRPILGFIQAQANLEAYLAIAAVITIVIGGILTIIYGYMYRIAGPSQYGPMDAPPIRGRKIKRYKR